MKPNQEIELKELKNVWHSTDGKNYIEKCNIITFNNGYNFFCNTHKTECEFNEGFFCPKN